MSPDEQQQVPAPDTLQISNIRLVQHGQRFIKPPALCQDGRDALERSELDCASHLFPLDCVTMGSVVPLIFSICAQTMTARNLTRQDSGG